MQTIQTGQSLPEVVFRFRSEGRWQEQTTRELFAGRVVAFSLPGAFTPTCSSAHAPRFNELAEEFFSRGVERIICLSVNDAYVMEAWQQQLGADKLIFLPDGNGELTAGLGLLIDMRPQGFGARSRRYAMIVQDGVVEQLFVEPDQPGDPYEVSDAESVLRALDGAAVLPSEALMFTKPGCGHCQRAREMLRGAGISFDELPATPRRLRAIAAARTAPQVFIDGRLIGGADALAAHLEASRASLASLV